MTAWQLEGMKARTSGVRTNPHPRSTPKNQDWRRGFDPMDDQIRQTLDNAQSMLSGMEDVRRARLSHAGRAR